MSAGLSIAAMMRAARTIFSLIEEIEVSGLIAIVEVPGRPQSYRDVESTLQFGNPSSMTYQVFPMLMTLIPSGRVFHRYGSI